jgi:AraC-like DNA-binding protein
MLTARVDVQDKLKALRIGVDDYLLKPFDEEELLIRIENLLKNQSMRLEYRVQEPASAEKTPLLSSVDRTWLETLEAYVRRHLASDLLTVPVLAHEFAMSESTLLRQLKRLTGLSPLQYIQEVRLHEARSLLENGTYNSVALVALKTGYDDPRYFSRIFRQQFGKSPSDVLIN